MSRDKKEKAGVSFKKKGIFVPFIFSAAGWQLAERETKGEVGDTAGAAMFADVRRFKELGMLMYYPGTCPPYPT